MVNTDRGVLKITWDDEYSLKVQQELAIYKQQVNVHDLPEIYHYWSNKFLKPMFLRAGFDSIEEFFVRNMFDAAQRTEKGVARFASIGSGNCDLEINLAKLLIDLGLENFIFDCIELNPIMLERGHQLAQRHEMDHKFNFIESDFNTWKAALTKYDAVIANQSLHHVSDLEHLYDQIYNHLEHEGCFVISDMIGRNGHQRWPEALRLVHRFWQELPDNYKYNILLNRHEEIYENWDCSKEGFEGIRAEEVLPLLLCRFKCQKFIGFGNVIDIFVDRCFGHHFNPNNESDKDFIDRVHEEDERGIRDGQLTPTHMLAVFAKELNKEPYYSRGISPEKFVRRQS